MTVSIEVRGLLIKSVIDGIADGSLEVGAGVKRLRVEVAKLRQSDFARMCKISLRTLIQIEQGDGNPTLKSLNTVFRPFGLQMGVIRRPDRRWDT
ncbi:helix-turn-helix transcriptional regulator [Pseudomonas wadenswilerensis]